MLVVRRQSKASVEMMHSSDYLDDSVATVPLAGHSLFDPPTGVNLTAWRPSEEGEGIPLGVVWSWNYLRKGTFHNVGDLTLS
jgi:hypothetical protein